MRVSKIRNVTSHKPTNKSSRFDIIRFITIFGQNIPEQKSQEWNQRNISYPIKTWNPNFIESTLDWRQEDIDIPFPRGQVLITIQTNTSNIILKDLLLKDL